MHAHGTPQCGSSWLPRGTNRIPVCLALAGIAVSDHWTSAHAGELIAHPTGKQAEHSQIPRNQDVDTSLSCLPATSTLTSPCKIGRYGIEIKAVHVPMAALRSLAVEAKRGRLIAALSSSSVASRIGCDACSDHAVAE